MTPLDTQAEIFAALKSLGFDSYTFDGAVMAFQYAHNLKVDGICGPETKKAIALAMASLDMPKLSKKMEEKLSAIGKERGWRSE